MVCHELENKLCGKILLVEFCILETKTNMRYRVGWGCFSPLSQSLSQPGGGSTTISVVKMRSCFEMSGDIPPCFGVFILLFIFNTFSLNQGIVLWLNKVRFHLLQMSHSQMLGKFKYGGGPIFKVVLS